MATVLRYRRPMTLRRYRLALALHLALLSSISVWAYLGRLHLPEVPHIDLLGHAVLYGALGALAHGALGFRAIGRVPVGPAMVLAGAGIEELLQGLSPYRHMSILDFAADVVGVTACVAGAARLGAGDSARNRQPAAT
jgi:VanZ family protein